MRAVLREYVSLISAIIVVVVIILAGVLVQAGLLSDDVLDTAIGILVGAIGGGALTVLGRRPPA